MTACISTAWEKIWDSDVNRKFGFDFEIYDERSHDWNNAEVAILISIAEEG
jgi:predicted transcriptional regulator YdeE